MAAEEAGVEGARAYGTYKTVKARLRQSMPHVRQSTHMCKTVKSIYKTVKPHIRQSASAHVGGGGRGGGGARVGAPRGGASP